MNPRKTLILAVVALALLGAGVFLMQHRSSTQADLGGGPVFADLKEALGEIDAIQLSKGDGSNTMLLKSNGAWLVKERNYPADPARVRDLALGLANLRVVERKTSDPANYARLGVEKTDSPTATGTWVQVFAGKKSWSLIVGKAADNRAVYVREPDEGGALLVSPLISADPDQKRWIDRLLVDMSGAGVQDVNVKVGKGPAYAVTRPAKGSNDLVLTPVPKGRNPVTAMSLAGQFEALTSFHFDDVRALPTPAPEFPDTATYRTFDGQTLEFSGRRDGEKAYVTVSARRGAAPAPVPAPTAAAAAAPGPAPAPEAAATPKPDQTTERLATRVAGVEYEIPLYKYEAIFKPYEEQLEKVEKPDKKK